MGVAADSRPCRRLSPKLLRGRASLLTSQSAPFWCYLSSQHQYYALAFLQPSCVLWWVRAPGHSPVSVRACQIGARHSAVFAFVRKAPSQLVQDVSPVSSLLSIATVLGVATLRQTPCQMPHSLCVVRLCQAEIVRFRG